MSRYNLGSKWIPERTSIDVGNKYIPRSLLRNLRASRLQRELV